MAYVWLMYNLPMLKTKKKHHTQTQKKTRKKKDKKKEKRKPLFQVVKPWDVKVFGKKILPIEKISVYCIKVI